MKKIKRLIGFVFLFTLLAFGVTSCGNNQTPTTTKTSEIVKNGKNVYFAGPMFNYEEKSFNLRLTNLLEEFGYKVFLPQRDGIEAALLEGKTEQELIDMIFPLDVQNVLNADIIFMNCDGRVPDEGACVELGIGYNAGKRCYGFKTDTRSVEKEMNLNPMIAGAMIKIFKNYDGDALVTEIREYLTNNIL
ncbi:MAG: nucleoside 2-deoxyribosyltransferase [Acholeplasmatales bacterium]|nr:nucleoside 2-deoxyribosyltransferase [Acholeplasmatales bacterium]